MKKKFNTLIILSFLSLIFLGCATTQNIYTMTAPTGQMYFIRSTKVSKLPKTVKSCEFDITVRTDDNGEIIDNPVLNYTFGFDKNNYNNQEKTGLSFVFDDVSVEPKDSQKIYKEIGNGKNLTVRYTSTINKDDFTKMVFASDVKIIVKSNGTSVEQTNKVFAQKLAEMGVLFN